MRVVRCLLASLAVGAMGLGTVGVVTSVTVSTVLAAPPGLQTPAPNPHMVESCGADVTLVLDASGSISSSHAVDNVRRAAESFLDALADTGSTARVLQFASISAQLAPQAEVTEASMQAGGLFRTAINDYYNPIPPRPNGVTIYQYDGNGDPQSANNFRQSNGSNQYTNWDQSLEQAAQVQPKPIELVVYVTDGDPTAFDFNQPGDPFDAGPPPDVAISTDRDQAAQTTLDRAVQEANRIKNSGARMLAVGVGSAVTGNPSSRNRLIQIAGPQTVNDAGLNNITSINQVDVALVTNFDKLAAFLRGVVNELCTPSLTVRKLAQTADSANYSPAPDWSITAAPTVAGLNSSYRWILPDTDPVQLARCGNPPDPNDQGSRTCPTDATGLASFQWEPNPADNDTSAVITETLKAGYTAGRPNDPDWRCILKNNDGTQDEQSGEFGAPGSPALGFRLTVDPNQIITCVMYNSFIYQPAITLTKQNTPTQVRGDLSPPANTVTSTFTVTNPGNTPLANVTVTDNKCKPTFVSGDGNNNGRLDVTPPETWIFSCTRNLLASAGSPPLPVTNNAEVTGVDPNGTVVFATATADTTAYAPAITLTKTASPTRIPVGAATPVTYNYVATNTGNMTLTNVTVTDNLRAAACTPVTPASVPILVPGASTPFTCTTTLTPANGTATFPNTARVVGNPIFPDGTAAPPAVTAEATAVVTSFEPGIDLVKTVDHTVVLPGTPVTYTYTVTNNGTVNLVRPAPPGSPDPRDGWVVDTAGPTGTCAPVTFVPGGDAVDPNVLDIGETWTYTCTTILDGGEPTVINTASVVAEVQGNPTLTVTDSDDATVDVVVPKLELQKSAVRPVVLDPAAPAIAGPDVPQPTPAGYLYTVTNTGLISVRGVVVTDVFPVKAPPQKNCPVTPVLDVGTVRGDVNANSSIDPGESWHFECVLDVPELLTKADSDLPPGPNTLVPSTVTNTATATGTAFFQDGATVVTTPVTSNSATAQVQVISPSLSMTKEPCLDDGTGALTCSNNLLVRPGTDVTFRYLATNTGDSNLQPIFGKDDSCGDVSFFSGDSNGNRLIDGGLAPETWEYRCVAEINRPSPAVNHATLLAADPLGNQYEVSATATVRIFEPAIHLTKTVSSDLVPAGSTVTYTFQVTNAGTVTDDGLPAEAVLSNIGLLDVSKPANPSCTNPTFVGGDSNQNQRLDIDPLETWTYQCTGVINERTINGAAVGGRDIQNGLVADFDAATVTPFATGIHITKTATPTVLPAGGGSVTYNYEVTNTGNVPLSNIDGRVVDDKCPNVVGVNIDGINVGDFDQNGVLTGEGDLFETGGPEVWLFTCTMNLAATTVNTVSVIGTPVQPVPQEPSQLNRLRTEAFVVLAPDVTSQAVAQVVIQESGVLPPATTVPPQVAPVPPVTQLPRTGLQIGIDFFLIALGAIGIGIALRMPARRRSR